MEKYEPVMSFDEAAAEVYDDVSQRGDEMETVSFLEQLARGGPALELAIGTGRIALPLAARGIRVGGIDFSAAMVAKLRAKPGGAQIAVTMGNLADVAVKGTYRLIYLVFNTLFNLLSQDEQVRCFENVADSSHRRRLLCGRGVCACLSSSFAQQSIRGRGSHQGR